ncbi:MAG: hypothetical protein ACKO37_01105 [Vampirovibrionales bacterium]
MIFAQAASLALQLGGGLFKARANRKRQQAMNAEMAQREAEIKGLLNPRVETPSGTMTQENGTMKYQHHFGSAFDQQQPLLQEKSLQAIQALPTQTRVEDVYNNPFYDTTSQLLTRLIEEDKANDTRQVTEQLAARGLTGGSYDALLRKQLAQRYGQRIDQARMQARQQAASAYQQSIQTQLNILSGLRSDQQAREQLLSSGINQALDMRADSQTQARTLMGLNSLAQQRLGEQNRQTAHYTDNLVSGDMIEDLLNYLNTRRKKKP